MKLTISRHLVNRKATNFFDPRERLEVLRKTKLTESIADGVKLLPHRSMVQLDTRLTNHVAYQVCAWNVKKQKAIRLELQVQYGNSSGHAQIIAGNIILLEEDIKQELIFFMIHNGKCLKEINCNPKKIKSEVFTQKCIMPGDVSELRLFAQKITIDRVSANYGVKKSA